MASGGADGREAVEFQLSPSSSTLVKIQRGKIAQWSVDGSSDAILREACYKVPEARPGIRCPTGEARITPGFKLAASHVILTAGPIYASHPHPKSALESSYRYPFDDAAKVALSTIKEFGTDFKEVHLVLFSDEGYDAYVKAANELLQN
nr:Macro domain-containing protein [Ipomoea batatas]